MAAATGLLAAGLLCACRSGSPPGGMNDTPRPPLSDVLARHTPELMVMPGVVGTAESQLPDGRPCVMILIARRDAALERSLPRTLEGWPVKIEVTGEIRAMPDSGR